MRLSSQNENAHSAVNLYTEMLQYPKCTVSQGNQLLNLLDALHS